MLGDINKTINVNAASMVEEEKIADFTCTIGVNGRSGAINPVIRSIDLYEANRTEYRKDLRDFQDHVWDLEDNFTSQTDEE